MVSFSRSDFSWEGGGTLPNNNFKPPKYQYEKLHCTIYSVQRLERSFGTHKQTDTLRKISCYFYIRISLLNQQISSLNPTKFQISCLLTTLYKKTVCSPLASKGGGQESSLKPPKDAFVLPFSEILSFRHKKNVLLYTIGCVKTLD